MSFYRSCMRNASVILFWVAVAGFFAGLLTPILVEVGQPTNPYSANEGMSISTLVAAFYSGVSTAIMPFFGSALLYLLDSRLPGRAGETAK